MMSAKNKYIAFLRGINLGSHHKVPMEDLRNEMEEMGFENAVTILNSGNVIFDTGRPVQAETISTRLEEVFGFPVPTVVVSSETIHDLLGNNPFEGVAKTKDIRLYVSFLWEDHTAAIKLPWSTPDNAYQIIGIRDGMVFSILDLSVAGTPQAMEALEKIFGKEITTRNWNTIERIGKKL